MSSHLKCNLAQDQITYACAEEGYGSASASSAPSNRDLFTHQTGQLLLALGHMLINVSAFNAHIQPSTGKRLIALGKKLSAQK
ncbi:MAG: hypothetical protein HY867_14750 [Chloroflexi bacterium]|nr:hypothetical protein [Chloroflexota bacterium]